MAVFIETMQQHGITIVAMPGKTLTYTPETPPPIPFTDSINHMDKSPYGWIFTSQHGATGLFKALPYQALTLALPKPQHILTVGTAAAGELNAHGWQTHPATPAFGHSQALGQWLSENYRSPQQPPLPVQWIWPCGTERLEAWADQIQQQHPHVTVYPWPVYRSSPIRSLTPTQQHTLQHSDGLILTSPGHLSGLINAGACLPDELFALGPTTAQAIQTQCQRPAAAVAPHPNWKAMADTLLMWRKSQVS